MSSVLTLRDLQTGGLAGWTVTTTEVIPPDAGAKLSTPMKWTELGAVRVGVCGKATVTGQPVTVRLRTGGAPASRGTVAGDVVHTFVIPVGADQVIEELSPPVTPSVALSYLQVTAQTASGTAALTFSHMQSIVVPVDDIDAQLFATPHDALGAGMTEVVGAEWVIDFDRWKGSPSLKVTLTGRGFDGYGGAPGTFRVRAGGTHLGADGTVLASMTSASSMYDGSLASVTATVANPLGAQYLKVTSQSATGGGWELRGCSVLVKAA